MINHNERTMDPIYNNKKYFQSLNHGGGDYYRSGTLRHLGNDYSSYHNTLVGHRGAGTLLPHASPSSVYNKYSYATDLSLSSNSHYGYTSWGLWRGGAGGPGTDSRNISPSIYSHHNGSKKRRRNIKSFSILLMSAAMIVVLAVLAVAGLAFYFSTFKSDPTDSILIFDSTMSVTKGDIFTASLKNPHALAYQQKSNFYERLLRNALEHAGLTVAKINISSFGDGPFINLTFRVFLDMRKIQVTINNVEEHMKNAFLNEIALPVTEYKELFVNPDSIHIKRLLDQDVLKSASFMHHPPSENLSSNESPKILEQGKSAPKKPGIIERPLQKISSSSTKVSRPNTKPITSTDKSLIHEPDIDVDILPVIQGSFEVTKTEADITRNRESLKTTSTLKPFMISPASIKINDKKGPAKPNNTATTGKIEKTNKITSVNPSSVTTPKNSAPIMTSTMKPTTSNIGSTEKMIDTTVDQTKRIQNKNPEIEKPKPGSIGIQTLKELLKTEIVAESVEHNKNLTENVPILDLNLFTTAPVVDEEPWHPIDPNSKKPETESQLKENITEINAEEKHSVKKASPPQMTIKDELLMYRNKLPTLDSIEQSYADTSGGMIYYKAFNNPGFIAPTDDIEHLGAMDVRPYPLPVNKLTDDPTQFAYDLTDVVTPNTRNVTVNQDKFEHLGGGVIVKRPESTPAAVVTVSTKLVTNFTTTETPVLKNKETDEDLLDEEKVQENINSTYFGENKLESRAGDTDIEALGGSGEKLSIVNLKDYIMQNKFKPTEKTKVEEVTKEVKPVTAPTTITSTADTSSVWEEAPQLFPIGSKWEFVNGTRVTPFENMGMRKVYNETLQALVVENSQLSTSGDYEDYKAQKPNRSDNIPGISSLFDTIHSKIGIQEESGNKAPPFSTHNKMKTTQAMSTTTTTTTTTAVPVTTTKKSTVKVTTTTKRPITTTSKKPTTVPRIIYKQTTPSSTTTSTTKKAPTTSSPKSTTTTTTTTEETPVILYRTSDAAPLFLDTSSESMFMGEAEVEVVDPNAYEEILKQSQTVPPSTSPVPTTTPRNTPLVTLLPVKSNSGIRNFSREKLKHSPGIMQSAANQERATNKSFNSRGPIRGPIFAADISESVVKTSMNVEV